MLANQIRATYQWKRSGQLSLKEEGPRNTGGSIGWLGGLIYGLTEGLARVKSRGQRNSCKAQLLGTSPPSVYAGSHEDGKDKLSFTSAVCVESTYRATKK